MSPQIRRRIPCRRCEKSVAVQGSWPDEYVRNHVNNETGVRCDGSGEYLLPGVDTTERAANWTPPEPPLRESRVAS